MDILPTHRATLLLARHGETVWNREKRFQGQQDPPLADRGREQAKLLALRLEQERIDICYSSDLSRARETTEAIRARIPRLRVSEDCLVREVGMGQWEGKTQPEVQQAFAAAWREWSFRPDWDTPACGEGAFNLDLRARSLLSRVETEHPGQTVLVVTHGGFIQATLNRALGGPSIGHYPFELGNTSLSILHRRGEIWWVDRVNDTSHLIR